MVHNIIFVFGLVKAASLPKPEQRLITATDVFDVVAEQCHHGKRIVRNQELSNLSDLRIFFD